MRQPFTHTVVSLLCILLASCLVGVGEVDVQSHDGEVGEARGHVLLGENTSLPALNLSLAGDEWSHFGRVYNVDHVPELGVMGVHGHVQPLQEEFRIQETC